MSSPAGCHACFAAWCGSLAPGRSWRTGRMARYRTECIRLPYAAPAASRRAFFVKVARHAERGTHDGFLGLVQIKTQGCDNQLCFQPAAQFFIHLGMRASKSVIACPRRKRGYVTGIVADHRVYRVRLSPDSGGDYWIREQGRPRACRFRHPHHLPSALSAADRLSACGY